MADKPDEQLPFDELQFNTDLFSKILNVDPAAADAVRKLFDYVTGDPILIGMSSSGLLGKMAPEQKIGLLDAKINQDAPISIDERAALRDAFNPIADSLIKVIGDDIERMGSRLFDVGFPDPRGDHGAWRIIAKMVGCNPDGFMEDIFDSAMAYHASKQQADNRADEDCVIDSVARSMVWGDDQFGDIPARGVEVLSLLLDAYRDGNRVVTLDEIKDLGHSVDGGMIGQIFKAKGKRHRVSTIIDDLGGGRYRLKPPRKNP